MDYNALIGSYPFRALPEPTPARLVADLDRHNVDGAWVGHVPSVWYRDCAAGNDELFAALAPFKGRLIPIPTVNPAFPGVERELQRAREMKCPAVRVYPKHHGYSCAGEDFATLGAICAELDLEIVLTVRFEDGRQRSRLDVAGDLIGPDIRNALRHSGGSRLLVTAADRAIIEEVHWGSTPQESARIRWDISWIWGAPDDHLGHLYKTIGRERFVFGSHFPFRLMESAAAKLELHG